jgi:hypothetical protein
VGADSENGPVVVLPMSPLMPTIDGLALTETLGFQSCGSGRLEKSTGFSVQTISPSVNMIPRKRANLLCFCGGYLSRYGTQPAPNVLRWSVGSPEAQDCDRR